MVEGTFDDFFRHRERIEGWHTETAEREFDAPVAFVPQRTRVLQSTKSVRGIATYLTRGINPLRWFRWIRARRDGAASTFDLHVGD